MKSRKQDYRGLSWHWLITKLSSGSGATTDRLGFAGRLALEKRKVIFNLWQRPGSWANRSPLQSPECSLHCNGIYFSVRQGHVSECLMRNALAWNLLEWSQNRSVGVEEPRKDCSDPGTPGGVHRVDQGGAWSGWAGTLWVQRDPCRQLILDNGHLAVDGKEGGFVLTVC